MKECDYPNLELIEYMFKIQLHGNVNFMQKFKALRLKSPYLRETFSVEVFPQTWPSTCTAFDVMPDGSPACGGQAFTKAYTTVICEENTNTYGVFIGNNPCYLVEDDITNEFFEDLKNRQMKSLSEAKKSY